MKPDLGESMWRGKKLKDYTKEELIEIAYSLAMDLQITRTEHIRQLGVLFPK